MKKPNLKNWNKIFYNNRYLFVFSVILSIIIWVAVVMEFSPETEFTIQNVPVTVDNKDTSAEALGLQPYGANNFTVDITVIGPRYSVNASEIKVENFNVTALASDISSVGEHNLPIKATIKDKNANYTIESLSKEYVSVYFDNYISEKVLDVNLEGLPETDLVSDEYYCEGAVLSRKTITVSGAATQINELGDSVTAVFDSSKIKFPLTDSVKLEAEVQLQDAKGNELQYIDVDGGTTITATIPVLSIKSLPTTVNFKNMPVTAGNDLPSNVSFSISEPYAKIAATDDVLDGMNEFSVGTIDFNDIKVGTNVFTFKASEITSAKVLEDVDEFKVTVRVTGTSSKTIDIPSKSANITNIPDGYKAEIVSSDYCLENVLFYGPTDLMNDFDEDKVTVTIDLSSIKTIAEGRQSADAAVTSNQQDIWAYGSYKVIIDLSK